jgi:hypothetical protein
MIRPLGYVPLLRWRQGEYLALRRLDDDQKDLLTPLVEVLDPDYDFEERRPKKTLDEHLEKFGKRLLETWDCRPFLLDTCRMTPTGRMADGRLPLRYMFDEAAARGVPAIPVTGLARDAAYQAAVRSILKQGKRGLGLRFQLTEARDSDFGTHVDLLLKSLDARIADADLIIDLESPSFDDPESLADVIVEVLGTPGPIQESRSVTVLATSFPDSLAGVAGVKRIPRQEWLLFKAIKNKLSEGARTPAFGDYTISAFRFEQGDMRKLTVVANVRYTTDDAWLVGRGKEIRVHGRSQFKGICASIREADGFLPAGFSPGSRYLCECADGGSTGGSSTWKWVGINHHITKVLHDLAILSGS